MRRHGRPPGGPLLVALVTLVALLASVPETRAAYPGRNGELVYSSRGTLRTVGANGTGQRNFSGAGSTPAWSPDGTKIAFTSSGQNADIYVVDVTGANLRRLTTDAAYDGQPTWSPDGKRIAFSSTRNATESRNASKLWVMNADGSGQARLTTQGSDSEAQPAWSPDGTRIAYMRYQAPPVDSGFGTNIWILTFNPRDLPNYFQVTYAGTDRNSSPDWSADSRFIAFDSNRDGRGQIYGYELATGINSVNPRRLFATNNDDTDPAWSPDGFEIAVTRGPSANSTQTNIVALHTRTGAARSLSTDAASNREASWRQIQPGIAVNPTALDFGARAVGSSSDISRFTVQSTGTAPLNVTSVTVGGSHGGDFVKALDGCSGKSLPPGGSCEVQLRFVPTAVGARSGQATIVSDDPGGPKQVSLRGTGQPAPPPPTTPGNPALSVTPPGADFGTQLVLTGSEPRTFTARNTGSAPLQISAAALAAPDAGDFAVTADSCTGNQVPPGARCEVKVRFIPTVPGVRRSSLEFRSNAPGSPHLFPLTGSGTTESGKPPPLPPAAAPTLIVDPPLGPPGFVTTAVGAGFPPQADITLTWTRGLGTQRVRTDGIGAFQAAVLILHRDMLGPRELTANAAGGAPRPSARTPFLVVPSSVQPATSRRSGLLIRR